MKTTLIQLEEHDDIISVQDRLAWADSARVVLIWPEEGRILTRLLDLVLLQRLGRQQGVQIGLVCRDPEVIEHARELGIPLFRSQKRALKGIWRRKPQRLRLLRPRRSSPRPPGELRKERPERVLHSQPILLRGSLFGLALLAVGALVLFLIPAATILLPLEKSPQQMDLSVWISPDLGGLTLAGGVPAEVFTVVMEEQGEIPTTGRVLLPDQTARGEVVFTNITEAALTIPQGTVVQTLAAAPVRFTTLRPVSLAGGIGQTVTVDVEAEQPGSGGNIAGYEIQAIQGTVGLAATVMNPEPLEGGSDRFEAAPSAADQWKLRSELNTRMSEKAGEWLRGMNVEGAFVVPQSIQVVRVIEEEWFPAEGAAGESLQLRLKVEYEGWVVQGEDLQRAISNLLDANLEDGMTGVEDSLWFKLSETTTREEGGRRWTLTAKRQTAHRVEASQIIEKMVGKTRQTALEILTTEFSLGGEAEIFESPAWWPFLPLIESQIRLEVQ